MATVAVVASDDPKAELTQQATNWVSVARTLAVKGAETYRCAAEYLLAIKALRTEADQAFDPIIADANRTHKTAIEQKRKVEGPLMEAERVLKTAMGAYEQEQRRVEETRRRELEEQARREALEQREYEIESAEIEGATREEIKSIAAAPVRVAPVTVPSNVPAVKGIVPRDSWRFEVTNKLALDKFIGTNPQFSNLTMPNSVAIGALVRSLRSAMQIPGIRVWNETNISARKS